MQSNAQVHAHTHKHSHTDRDTKVPILHNTDSPSNPRLAGVPHSPPEQRKVIRERKASVDEILLSSVKSLRKVCRLVTLCAHEQCTATSALEVMLKVKL